MQSTKAFMPVLAYGKKLEGAETIAAKVGALAQRSPLRAWGALACDYAVIIGAICLFHAHPSVWLWLPLLVLVGSRQLALAVLMHEASHGNLYKNIRLNNWVGQVLCAYPLIAASLFRYQARHRKHHVYLNTSKDPDWQVKAGDPDWEYPTSLAGLGGRSLRFLAGGGVLFLLKTQLFSRVKATRPAWSEFVAKLGYFALLLALVTYTKAWLAFILVWLLPLITVMPFFERFRNVAEHFGLDRSDDFNATRSVYGSKLSRMFFAPHNVSFHLEHHLYPMVPFYNLPQLAACLDTLPQFRARAHKTANYTALVRELTASTPMATAPVGGEVQALQG